MITFDIVDQADHNNRIRILGSEVGKIMMLSIEEQMRILDNENNTHHNSYFTYLGNEGIEEDGKGTIVYGILKLLSSPKHEFWDFANACMASLGKEEG